MVPASIGVQVMIPPNLNSLGAFVQDGEDMR